MGKNLVASDKKSREYYFPSLLFVCDLADAEDINSELTTMIRGERSVDQKGIHRSNIPALGGWHSKNDLHQRADYKRITQKVLDQGAFISSELGYAKSHKLAIDQMWSIINGPGSFNKAHIHPGSIWSGVYYVQAPENAGDIEFTDPRTENLVRQAKFEANSKRPRECWTKVRFTPKPGKMILFPSWLYHSVDANLTQAEGEDAERIIISFNLSQYQV